MSPLVTAYSLLALAVALEVVGTSLLAQTQQFTRLLPTLGMVTCYLLAFYILTHILKVLPVGITYALWSGFGIIFISAVGYFWLRQSLDLAAIIGIGLIVAGVVVINLFSTSSTH